MEQKKNEAEVTYWHPAFYAEIQIELEEDADNLVFESEHQLGTKPMEIDVLIIKKETDRPVKKNIGKIFRKHNIVEYKSPGSSLSVDDFYKVYGYTCFYKADVPYINCIPVEELTITFISERYPRELILHLKTVKKYDVEMSEPGIYSVKGDFFPIQIIVTRNLSEDKNLWLKSLTNRLEGAEKAKKLIEDYMRHAENNLYHSVLETIMRANQKTFEEVNDMSDIIMEIVQEKFNRKLEEQLKVKLEEKLNEELEEKLEERLNEELEERLEERLNEELAKQEKQFEKKTEQDVEKVTEQVTKKTKLTDRIELVQKKCRKNKPLSMIADELETDEDEILSVYNAVSENPGMTVEEIYELVAG